MSNYIIEIGDEGGKSFKVSLTTMFNPDLPGHWRVLENGYIRFNSGHTRHQHSNGTLTSQHIEFLSGENTYGLRLNDFQSYLSVEKQGTGYVFQEWVTGLRSGRISWAVVG